ncbi:EAL domain-containing protein [Polycladidibacter stylochi]|uniref:EAL domain-containing protein n=1 Tax=Polycladidibacter stylochi TaxID=1807766 RepID=UPI0008350194|nr:EAL domain-containing protein [Pseudovibrio stylochi]
MSRRYTLFLKAVCISLVLALGPLVTANYVLENYAYERAAEELDGAATNYISKSEALINEAVTVLKHFENNSSNICSIKKRSQLAEVLRNNPQFSMIGVVDQFGSNVCSLPFMSIGEQTLLPKLDRDTPKVNIGILERHVDGIHYAIVSWRLSNNWRLFIEINPMALQIESLAGYLARNTKVSMMLGTESYWVTQDSMKSRKHPDYLQLINDKDTLNITRNSNQYPVSVILRTNRNAILILVRGLKAKTAMACAVGALALIIIGFVFAWRSGRGAEDDFVKAITNDEFIPYYQPVIDIDSGKLIGCEVLMRWYQGDGSIKAPGYFMTYAESSGHIFEMTRRIMRQTVIDLGELYERNPNLKISINLFAGHFKDKRIIKDVKRIYGESPISLDQLIVEVTERQPLEDIEQARRVIGEFQSLGVRVALDDVGTGHGGLAYLQKLGMDILKIDKMFIDPMGSAENTATIVDIIVELGDNLGMGIIAEGVESYSQIKYLRDLGVTAAQGFILSKPLPIENFLKFASDVNSGRLNPVKKIEERARASL